MDIGNRVVIGSSDLGTRSYIPIIGGHFCGAQLNGIVLPNGQDAQLQREDGVLEIDARYSIKTDDGEIIMVHNQGIVAEKDKQSYARTTPKFHAPLGNYDWLNKRIFVGTIKLSQTKNQVQIDIFEVA